MVDQNNIQKILKDLDYILTDQIERIIHDPQLSYMRWDEILSDINLSLEIWNKLEANNKKTDIRTYLEPNFYDEELEDLINKLKQVQDKK
jgi:hypothetical protein